MSQLKVKVKSKPIEETKANIITISLFILALGIVHHCSMCYSIQRLLLFLLTVARLHLLVFLPACHPLHYSWLVLLAKTNDCTWTVFHTHGFVSSSGQSINIQWVHRISISCCVSCTFWECHCNHSNIVRKLMNSFSNTAVNCSLMWVLANAYFYTLWWMH